MKEAREVGVTESSLNLEPLITPLGCMVHGAVDQFLSCELSKRMTENMSRWVLVALSAVVVAQPGAQNARVVIDMVCGAVAPQYMPPLHHTCLATRVRTWMVPHVRM